RPLAAHGGRRARREGHPRARDRRVRAPLAPWPRAPRAPPRRPPLAPRLRARRRRPRGSGWHERPPARRLRLVAALVRGALPRDASGILPPREHGGHGRLLARRALEARGHALLPPLSPRDARGDAPRTAHQPAPARALVSAVRPL